VIASVPQRTNNGLRLPDFLMVTNARRPCLVLTCLMLGACATAANRPEVSTLGCVQSVLMRHVPAGLNDKQAHCLAAGLISRYCSRTEANMAAAGKEIADLFDAGDAEWADWRADRAGIRCAKAAISDEAVSECCKSAREAAAGLRNK
jgi:hypothetical protein